VARGAERGKPASRRRHSPRSTTRIATKTARRPLVISKAHLRAIRQHELLRDRVTALLRYCGSRNRVAALLRLRYRRALVLSLSLCSACSPRPHRELAVPTTTPTFQRYRTCVVMYTACLCKGGFVVGAHKAARLEPWLDTSTPDLDTIPTLPRHPDTPTPVSIDTRSDTPTPVSGQCQASVKPS